MEGIVETGYYISKNCEDIEKTLYQLSSLNMDNLKGLILYSIFQKEVMEDDFGAYETFLMVRRQEESRNLLKTRWDQSQIKRAVDNNAAIVIVSGNIQNIGTVIDANHEIQQILGYNKEKLISESITLMMPEIIGENHNTYMKTYFTKQSDSNENNVLTKLIIALHKKGYIVPCYKVVRLVSNLENGVQFLGFLSPPDNLSEFKSCDCDIKDGELHLLLLDNNYEIIGLCKKTFNYCCDKMASNANIKKYLESDQKINIKRIYPHLFSEDNKASMEFPEGLTTSLDLNPLKKALNSEIIDDYTTMYIFIIIRNDDIKFVSECSAVNLKLTTFNDSLESPMYKILSFIFLETQETNHAEVKDEINFHNNIESKNERIE